MFSANLLQFRKKDSYFCFFRDFNILGPCFSNFT